jgi:hypothetical protein
MMLSASSTPHIGRTPDPSRSSFYIGLLALLGALLVLPLPSAAQTTQTLSLNEGWNLVSLHVQPDDPSFASIFGGTDGAISSVKNEDGAAYLPTLGIEQISTWRADEGYKVHAEAATTVKIVGTELSPGSVAIALEEGGNIVPYLPDRVQAVEEAVMSIEQSLIAVEAEDGRRYPSGSTPLDSLRPGQGYKVYVDRADTLRYPVVARTLDNALALTGVPVGEHVRVLGYHEPGDGGGGLFRVTQSGAATDGGTVFVFDEDRSAQKTESVGGFATWPLPDSDLIWGSLGIRYGPDPEDVLSDFDMHGHNGTILRESPAGWIDYKNGSVLDGAGNPLKVMNSTWGDGRQRYTVRYQHAISDRRLERVGVTDAVNIAWWGAPEADPNNPKDAGNHLRWALNTAKNIYDSRTIDWAYVDIPGEYYYLHEVRIPDGVMVRGVGPDRPVPGRNFTVNGAITLMPGKAVYYKKKTYDPVAEHDEYKYLSGLRSSWLHQQGASTKIGMYNLEFNGNLDNNLDPLENRSDYDNIQPYLQNSGDWNAWYTTGKGADSYEKGFEVYIDNVYAHSYGANTFAGGGAGFDPAGASFKVTGQNGPSTNVHLVDAARNHQVYGMPGDKKDWTIDGYFWASPIKFGSRNSTPSYWEDIEVRGMPPNPFPFGLPRNVWSTNGVNITVNGMLVDLRNTTVEDQDIQQIAIDQTGAYDPSVNGNSGNAYKNFTIKASENDDFVLLGMYFSQHSPILWENVTVEDYGGTVTVGSPSQSHTYNVTYKSFTLEPQGNLDPIKSPKQDGARFSAITGLRGFGPDDRVPEAMRRDFINFDWNRAFNNTLMGIGGTGQENGKHPFDQYVIDSSFKNRDIDGRGNIFRVTSNDYTTISPSHTWLRMYMDNTTINVVQDLHKWTGADAVLRMRNCQDREGRTSDASGTYTSTTTDEGSDFVLIPTSLMTRPGETSATVTSGNRTVQSVEIANSDGTLRSDDNTDEEDPYLKVTLDAAIQSGGTIDVDWAVRVTPLDEYRTTGLFVARPVPDKTFSGGSGPFTVDLRGVASSQETKAHEQPKRYITYSATSSDTGVVTASVQENGYTLELTDQSAGTATITVTGSIDGVGTTTDTFEVTVE